MELIVTILVAFPIGFFIKNRLAAYVVYIAIHSFVFTFQSLSLLIDWVGGDTSAFGSYPKADSKQVWSYGAVNLIIFAAGLGLVTLGYYLAAKRRAKQSQAASFEPTS